MDAGGLRAEWGSRPWTLRLYVGASLTLFACSAITDAEPLDPFSILGMLVFLALLRRLREGERALWWLFLVVSGAGAAIALAVAFDEPVAWVSFVISVAGLYLLVAEPTQAFVRQRGGKRVP